MPYLRWFCYGIMLTVCLWVFPVEASYKCAPMKKLVQSMFDKKYAFVASADGPTTGSAIVLFIDPNGNYKIIGVDKSLNGCELLSGTEWHFIMEQAL